MIQILTKLLNLLEREPVEKELWQNELEKLRQSTNELRQAHSNARVRYDDRIAELRDEAEELQGKLAVESFNNPANAKKIAEEMANVNAILKAAESIPIFEYCAQQTQKEREQIGQAYLASEQTEQLYLIFRHEIAEAIDELQLAIQKRESRDPSLSPWFFGSSRREIDNVADILVGVFKSEPGKPMPQNQQKAAMDRLFYQYKQKAMANAPEIIEQKKRNG